MNILFDELELVLNRFAYFHKYTVIVISGPSSIEQLGMISVVIFYFVHKDYSCLSSDMNTSISIISVIDL